MQKSKKKPRDNGPPSREATPFCIFVGSLGSDKVAVRQPIPVTIRPDGDEFVASFLDANISTGGDTIAQAIGNLQSLLPELILSIKDEPDENLGKSMLMQKRVLSDALCLK